MSIPENAESPILVGELNTIEQWRQQTNKIVNRLNSLYTSAANNLEVGNSIYADNLKIVDPNLSGGETLLVGDTDGLIRKTNIPTSDLSALIGGNVSGNLNVSGVFHVTDTTQSTNCDTGALMVDGGVGINKNLNVCGKIEAFGDGTTTGIVKAVKFVGDGSDLTNLDTGDPVWSEIANVGIHYSSGLVGIGVNPPLHILHIEHAAATALLKATNNSTPQFILQNSNSIGELRLDAGNLQLISGSHIFLSGDTSSGKVGIGTAGPSADLHIYNANSSQGTFLKLTDGATSPLECGVVFERTSTNTDYRLVNSNTGLFKLQKATDASSWTDFVTVDNTGKVGIGMSQPSEALQVIGNITISGDYISTSDVSIKENVKPILNPIEKVKELSGYTFNRIGHDKRSVGLMAQDVEKVLPEAVSENGDGVKSLAYGNLVALLVETVKEQQKQIDELREKLDK